MNRFEQVWGTEARVKGVTMWQGKGGDRVQREGSWPNWQDLLRRMCAFSVLTLPESWSKNVANEDVNEDPGRCYVSAQLVSEKKYQLHQKYRVVVCIKKLACNWWWYR